MSEKLMFFLVEISSSRLASINRINTWLTCHSGDKHQWGCPSVIGSNNIREIPNEDLKFAVQIRRGGYLPKYNEESFPYITVQTAHEKNFRIHYEVEGPCA